MSTPATAAMRKPVIASYVVMAVASHRSGQVLTIDAAIWLGEASTRWEMWPASTAISHTMSSPPSVTAGGATRANRDFSVRMA